MTTADRSVGQLAGVQAAMPFSRSLRSSHTVILANIYTTDQHRSNLPTRWHGDRYIDLRLSVPGHPDISSCRDRTGNRTARRQHHTTTTKPKFFVMKNAEGHRRGKRHEPPPPRHRRSGSIYKITIRNLPFKIEGGRFSLLICLWSSITILRLIPPRRQNDTAFDKRCDQDHSSIISPFWYSSLIEKDWTTSNEHRSGLEDW